ncbi:MAG: hypothetical protein WC873_00815 [Candidatus Gracilibacteria bacterium]
MASPDIDFGEALKSVSKAESLAAKEMPKADNGSEFRATADAIEKNIPKMREAVDSTIQTLAQKPLSTGEDRIKDVLSILNSNLNFGLDRRLREGFIQGAASILQMLEGLTAQLQENFSTDEIVEFLKSEEVREVLKIKPKMSGNALGAINHAIFENVNEISLPVDAGDSPIRYFRCSLKKEAVSVEVNNGKLSIRTSPYVVDTAIERAEEFLRAGVRQKIAKCPITGISAKGSTEGKNGGEYFVDMFTELYIKTCL